MRKEVSMTVRPAAFAFAALSDCFNSLMRRFTAPS
jgi:hypothetical protein